MIELSHTLLSLAIDIDNEIEANKHQSRMFKELTRRIKLVIKNLLGKYAAKELPTAAKGCIFALHDLLLEIGCYIKQQKDKNKLQQYINHQVVYCRIQSYEQSLQGICQNLQLVVQDWNLVNIAEEASKDIADLKKLMVTLFTDKTKSMDEIIAQLGVLNSQYVDTMASLRQKQLKHVDLNQDILDKLYSVYNVLAMKSGRKIVKRKQLLAIKPDDITFLDDNPIGTGSFGQVYVAEWQGEKVAIKRAISTVRSDEIISMIEKEAEIWFPLKHKNVTPLWGVALNTDRPFLVMPYMPNGSVFEYLARNPTTSIKQRIKFMSDVAFGMKYLHGCGVSHGDLKADNILVGISV